MKQTDPEKTAYRLMRWNFLVCAWLILGMVLAVARLGSLGIPVAAATALAALFGAGCMAAARSGHRWCYILPVLFLVALFVLGNYLQGALGFADELIGRWNMLHADGIRLFTDNVAWNDQLAFWLAFGMVGGLVAWLLSEGGRRISCGCFVLFFTALMLLLDAFEIWAAVFLFTAFFAKSIALQGKNISLRGQTVTQRGQIWCGMVFILLLAGGILFNGEYMDTVDSLRENTRQEIRRLRYGEQVLPEGNLYKAGELQDTADIRLTVTTQQQKTLYLKGYVGGIYDDQTGSWEPLQNVAYSGDYRGMIKWLKKQEFDPLTQTARYYALGDTQELPETNTLQIRADTASREYGYVPASADMVPRTKLTEKKDQNFVSAGFLGKRSYTVEEVSGTRPAELLTLQDWISNPQTEEQKRYCEAEAVYRNFVYDVYTETDYSMDGLLDTLFWQDYEEKNEGVYSALTHVREVLKNTVQYTTSPEAVPEGDTPLYWGLFEAHEGNAMLFATAAVQALRLKGIPARYVEGYYLSDRRTQDSPDGTVALTGQDTHAWVEIYFDGMGWQPVDVTPGYYYDTMTLRQMVNLPDTVHKTAAVQDDGEDASEAELQDTMDALPLVDALYHGPAAVKIVLGVLALLLMTGTAILTILELMRMVCETLEKRLYAGYTSRQQVFLLNRCIHAGMVVHGVETELGWKSVSVDVQAAEKIEGIKAGECVRITHLFEKQMYGQIELESFEKRTIVSFLQRLMADNKKYPWKKRFRLHYNSLYMLPEFDRITKMSKERKKCRTENGQ